MVSAAMRFRPTSCISKRCTWKRPGATPRHKREAHSASLEELSNLFRYLHNPQKPAAELGIEVLASLAQGRITLDDVLYSRPSWEALTEGYEQHCADPSFVNYFWTLRTMQSPLLMLANAARHMPRARVLHSISTGYAGLVGCILKQLWGCQFLLSEHGIYTKERKIDLAQASWIAESSNQALNDSMDSGSGYIRMLWVRFFERIGHLVYESADQIIALYDGNRQRQIKDGAPPERTPGDPQRHRPAALDPGPGGPGRRHCAGGRADRPGGADQGRQDLPAGHARGGQRDARGRRLDRRAGRGRPGVRRRVPQPGGEPGAGAEGTVPGFQKSRTSCRNWA